MMREAAVAVGIVVLAVVTLGTEWSGVEVSPGEWRDRVSLLQWGLFGALLFGVGLLAGRWVPTWRHRVAVVIPTLLWLAWQLRTGTLWPIALTLYGGWTAACWLAGCAASGLLSRRGR